MEEKILYFLGKDIIEKFKGKLDIEQEMKDFLESSLSYESKEKALELLYLLQLYSNAYIGPDPRGKISLLSNVRLVLIVKSEEEFSEKIKDLENIVEMMKCIENTPIETAKRRIEDRNKYNGVKF